MGYRAENINQDVKKWQICGELRHFSPFSVLNLIQVSNLREIRYKVFNPSIVICFLVSDIREMQASWKAGTVGISLISSLKQFQIIIGAFCCQSKFATT